MIYDDGRIVYDMGRKVKLGFIFWGGVRKHAMLQRGPDVRQAVPFAKSPLTK